MADDQDTQRIQPHSTVNAQNGSIAIGSVGVTGDGDKNIIAGNNNQVIVNNYQVVDAGLTPVSSIPAVPSAPLPYFVGRARQVIDVVEALTETGANPVIAIQGMRGVGKTALLKQVANAVAAKFPGGVFEGGAFCSDDNNPASILKRWGRLCGQNLQKESEENLPAVMRGLFIARQTQSGPILAIVDDVRSDWSGSGIHTIQEALPAGVPLLITTSEAQVADELDAKVFNLEVFSRAESIQLLQTLSEGKINDAQADTFAQLSGDMPLALVLIAKNARKTGGDWLLTSMRDATNHMSSLKSGDAHKKEQSVKISFDLNYQSLAEKHPEAARIFRLLAIFAQPAFLIVEHFTHVLAETSKQRNPLGHLERESKRKRLVESEIWHLVDWSLLSKESIAGSEMEHVQLHTLLHEYARSLLKDTTEIEEAADIHIRYCVAFAQANPQINLQTQQKSTLEFEKSYEQLFQALKRIRERQVAQGGEWSPETAHQVVVLTDALDYYWQWQSRYAEQAEWLQVAYRCAQGNSLKQADYARKIGRALSWQGELDEAAQWMETCKAALGEDTSAPANEIRALMYIHSASIKFQQKTFTIAEEDCLRGLELVDEQQQPKIYAEGYNLLGAIKVRRSDLPAALKAIEKSLAIWKQVGDQYQVSRVGDNLRTVQYYLGDIAQLRRADEESLQYWRQFPYRIELANALTNCGLTHNIDREYESAIELHQQALKISDLLKVQRFRALVRVNLAWSLIALERYAEAETELNQSLEIQREFKTTENWIEAQRAWAAVALGRKQYKQAIEFANQALKLAKENEDPLEEGAALRALGQAFQFSGEMEQARICLESSLAVLRENEYKHESYLTLLALADLYKALSMTEKLQTSLSEARTLAQEMELNDLLDLTSEVSPPEKVKSSALAQTQIKASIPYLYGRAGELEGQSIHFSEKELLVGRAERCQIRLSEKSVSRAHATFILERNDIYVRDEGSTLGTYVNEKPIPRGVAVRIRLGDIIRIGYHQTFEARKTF